MISIIGLDKAVKSIVETIRPSRIYVFGSYANDTQNDSSDLDIFVVTCDEDEDTIASIKKQIRRSIRDNVELDIDLDILVEHERLFDRNSKKVYKIEYEVVEKGEIVYDRRAC